jgi:hypothetical protein
VRSRVMIGTVGEEGCGCGSLEVVERGVQVSPQSSEGD